jgi:hypothetical protein
METRNIKIILKFGQKPLGRRKGMRREDGKPIKFVLRK